MSKMGFYRMVCVQCGGHYIAPTLGQIRCTGCLGSLEGGTRIESHSQGAPQKRITAIRVDTTSEPVYTSNDGFTSIIHSGPVQYILADQDGEPLPEQLRERVEQMVNEGMPTPNTVQALLDEWNHYVGRDHYQPSRQEETSYQRVMWA